MDEQQQILVLMDAEGNYYLITPEALAQARVPYERKMSVARLMAGDEVEGYFIVGNRQPGVLASAVTFIPATSAGMTVLGMFAPAEPGQ
jgi:hypothetical protein